MAEIIRMPTAAGEGISMKTFEDVLWSNFDFVDPQSGLRYMKELAYREGDIILCTFPKTGTHWVANMMWKLKTFDTSVMPKFVQIESGQDEVFENMTSPRILQTHQKPSRLPRQHLKKGGKIVLLLRNPKDAMVSYYYHLKNAACFKNKQTWDEFFDSYMSGQIPMGSYFDYVQQWEDFLKNKNDDVPVEVFYYEDLQLNIDENLARLNKFLGFNRDEKYLEKLKELTTLSALSKQYSSNNRIIGMFGNDDSGNSVIFRKGEIGDWKTHLTVFQSERVDMKLAASLRHGLINIKYEI